MIQELYKQAGGFHGHFCPGLAIEVRAAWEARKALDPEENGSLQCLAEATACWLDGIQFVLGATTGNGRLKVDDRGKAAFNFYAPQTGESLRLYLKELPTGLPKQALIDFILTAPETEIFQQGPTRLFFPAAGERAAEAVCCRCGERVRLNRAQKIGEEIVCQDCAI